MSNRFAIYLLALGAFVIGTAEFVVSGVLEIISQDLKVSISVAGQLVTLYALSYAFGALVLVMLTARFDRKKVLLYSMLVFVAGNIIAFFSINFSMLMLSRIVLAMSGGLFFFVATHYDAQLAHPAKRGSAIATVITGFTVSLVLGVPIGTLTAAYMDWRYIYLIIAVVTLINVMLLNKFIPKLAGSKPISLKHQLLLIKDKKVISGLLTTVFWILGYTMIFAYIAPLLSNIAGFSIEEISTALLILGVFAFIGSRVGGYAVDKWGPVRTISISLIVHSTALFVLTVTAASPIGVLLTIMVWGIAAWATTPANQFYLMSLKPQSSEVVLSYNTALMNIGMTLGAGLGGVFIKYISVQNLGWIGGSMVLLALVIASFSFKLTPKRRIT
ncbi:MFS transporter [Cohnella abietis]|uniref:Putative MFS-type transporter YbcL n=1 Tax=Cohnella abietis TaxID=2507935 RepID=A0A3T1D649_9BACL|nr:MFS transporter [Cohnella abietis]BBI33552.1 putative MFS-type transporter YbcL [Cohnella abietis]